MKLDEFTIGQVFETKSLKLTKEDIMRFAKEFDPQYMHLDEEKAKQGRFNGIIASGIHTMALSFKLWIEQGMYEEDVIAGTEMNNIKFIKPVYPGDELRTIVKVIDKKTKKSETGILTVLLSTYNKEQKVFEGELSVLIKR
ncbi:MULTISPECIES: MaoC family dehydratase [Priestia]|jgi:acyl dehydratase|uniref:MaoC family dehydratase n=1 Tax=Priestia TaxID=2800373 RepID=UPI00094D850D|nr:MULTISPECIES: MaoC family dehydratase [Priestia]MBE2974228.1 MaoC family dehydratase [Priestia megaterium]MBT2255737.1 MaoC family dehydratase [Priestia megaterium]MBT2279538.1 MaoC family dehydratase [Priestia megaterium]MBY0089466.1 MaoC family dehydratase [Priestia aryabhattai]MBY0100945.1 MaoC family dehydratase [Priestia aryabhattai]